MLDFQATVRLLQSVFGSITKADIRQRSGVLHENAGELLPEALFNVIRTIGPIAAEDVFLDIGCGIENVVANLHFKQPPKAALVSRFVASSL